MAEPRRRALADRAARVLTGTALVALLALAAVLVAAVVARGLRGLDGTFLLGADSVEAARAGIGGALLGSLLTLAVALALSVPVGVGAALWLEEFAPRTRATTLASAAVANLAAVPPVIVGLLGFVLLLGPAGLPRSSPLVAGIVLAVATVPTVAIAARAGLGTVPPLVRDAARAVGADRSQVVLHHVLPLAAPAMLTGLILAVARALGEAAPLLLVGMHAFIPALPHGLGQPATVLPVQIFLWADRTEPAFADRADAAILVLLALVLGANGLAAWLRDRLERRR